MEALLSGISCCCCAVMIGTRNSRTHMTVSTRVAPSNLTPFDARVAPFNLTPFDARDSAGTFLERIITQDLIQLYEEK